MGPIIVNRYESLLRLGYCGKMRRLLNELPLGNNESIQYSAIIQERWRDLLFGFDLDSGMELQLLRSWKGRSSSIIATGLSKKKVRKCLENVVDLSQLEVTPCRHTFVERQKGESLKHKEVYKEARSFAEKRDYNLSKVYPFIAYAHFLEERKRFSRVESWEIASQTYKRKNMAGLSGFEPELNGVSRS